MGIPEAMGIHGGMRGVKRIPWPGAGRKAPPSFPEKGTITMGYPKNSQAPKAPGI